MTFTEIVNEVAGDLNLTSADAKTRIGRHVNRQYRRLVALPWLQISRRGEISQRTVEGDRYMTFPVTKLYSVFDPNRQDETLGERTFDEIRNLTPMSDPPNQYAIARADSASVTIFLDSLPASVYLLSADAELRIVTLSGNQIPKFNEDFHDILIYGAKALELLKMEKDLAAEADKTMENRISDLKFHIAKTSYLNYLQGKDSQDGPPVLNTIIPG
jgi:hypothetical protein